MADTVTLDPGTGGAVIATDDLGATGHVQLVKLVDGTDNGTGRIAGDASNGLDVDVTRSALPTGASTAAKQPALGTAGAASADVITIQGIASGTVVPVSDGGGSLTVDNAGTFAVQSDTELTTADLDTGAGTDTRAVVGIALAASGGAVLAGTANPLPISDNAGSLTVDNAGTFAVQIAANSSVNVAQVAGTTTDTNSGTKSAGTQRVVLATDQPQLTNALKVDGSAVTQPVSGTVNLGTAAVTNAGTFAVQDSEKIADDAAFTVGTTKLTPVGYLADQTATDSVNEGDIGAARITLDRKQIMTLSPSVDTEGATIAMNIDVDESEDAVKATAGKILGWYIYNDGTSEAYVKFYNDTVANVVVGTTVPVLTVPIPAGSAANVSWADMGGIPFSVAITIAATTGVTTADTGAPTTNQVIANVLYL